MNNTIKLPFEIFGVYFDCIMNQFFRLLSQTETSKASNKYLMPITKYTILHKEFTIHSLASHYRNQ